MSDNQKLREALQVASAAITQLTRCADRYCRQTQDDYCDTALRAIEQALALPTAEPVGEREFPPLPSCARWEERIKTLMQQCGHPNSMSIYQAFKQFQNEFEHEMIAYARAALSAGDAVDAQRYRWLREQHWSNSDICCVNKPKQNVRLGGMCPSGDLLDAVIDAALRKGQL